MANASDEVKSRADQVAESNDNEGFAMAVERFILPTVAQASKNRRASK
jgi:hydroxymethylpyrimidine pyrophosphatase-like HAD family hydrolase